VKEKAKGKVLLMGRQRTAARRALVEQIHKPRGEGVLSDRSKISPHASAAQS
jgi:hypothetical protein